MKKLAVLLFVAALLGFIPQAMAGDGFYPWPTPVTEVDGSAETQVFVNQESEYTQGFVQQDVKECGFHFTKDIKETSTIETYGSLHVKPDVLFFGRLYTENTFSSDVGNVFRTIDAELNQMASAVGMNADAGASIAFKGDRPLNVIGTGSGFQEVAQQQTLSGLRVGDYGSGVLGGTQSFYGTTNVQVSAKNF